LNASERPAVPGRGGDADVEGIVVKNGWLEGGAEIRTAESKASGY